MGLREVILVDAQKNAAGGLIDDAHPVFQIVHLFLGNGLPLSVNGRIRSANHLRPKAQEMQHILQAQGNFQIVPAFQPPRAGGCAPILAAMARIDYNRMGAFYRQPVRNGGNRPGTTVDSHSSKPCNQNETYGP